VPSSPRRRGTVGKGELILRVPRKGERGGHCGVVVSSADLTVNPEEEDKFQASKEVETEEV
jgi:hypothetical protein